MPKDSTYLELLAEENAAQRNGALDELSATRVDLRLANFTIASLETELFHVREDLGLYASELDATYDYAVSAGQYIEDLEKNADAAMAASQRRLRERIDVLEAEVSRLIGENNVNFDTPFQDEEVFLVEDNAAASPPSQDAEASEDAPAVSSINVKPYYDEVRDNSPFDENQ